MAFLVSSSAWTALADTSFEVLDNSLIAVDISSTWANSFWVFYAVSFITAVNSSEDEDTLSEMSDDNFNDEERALDRTKIEA